MEVAKFVFLPFFFIFGSIMDTMPSIINIIPNMRIMVNLDIIFPPRILIHFPKII